jgi:hypothetical protein
MDAPFMCLGTVRGGVALGVARRHSSEIPLTDVLVRQKRNRDGGLMVTKRKFGFRPSSCANRAFPVFD